MTQEIKERLEQVAETAWEQDQKTNPSPVNPHAYVYGYKAGAQTILENPGEWGLCSLEIHKQAVKTFDKITTDAINAERAIVDERNQLQSQLAEYRQALERILSKAERPTDLLLGATIKSISEIAKEALKQHDNETNNNH